VIFCLRSPAWAAVAGGRPEKCKKRPGRSLSAHWRHQFYTGAVDDRTVPSLFSEAEGEGGGGAFQSHGPFPSQHSSRWPSAKDPENRSLRCCRWPLRGGGGLPIVFGKAVLKGSPVTNRHTATATSGAHLPSLVKRGGWGGGGPVNRCLKVKWSELNKAVAPIVQPTL
jgi:hypothetical protein